MEKKLFWAGSFVALMLSFFYDEQIIFLFEGLRLSFLDQFVVWITSPLTVIILFLFVSTILLWREHKKKWIFLVWLSFGTTYVLANLIKILVSRLRPFQALSLKLVDGMDYSFASWNSSFPSMHAALVFALIPIIDRQFPKIKLFWITLAVLIAVSRIYMGVHYLSDIIAGAIIGIIISKVLIIVEDKYKLLGRWKN